MLNLIDGDGVETVEDYDQTLERIAECGALGFQLSGLLPEEHREPESVTEDGAPRWPARSL